MGKSIRIKTTPGGGDKYVSINVEQDFDYLEVLSVKIRQQDVYRRFCADYGVVVGRVILNDGFGAPNAKVSVFIPLDEEDEDNTLITSIYPYKRVTDQNDQFIRYNILPDYKQNQNHQPVGTFPSKRKVLNNDVYLDVYDKYYKFTTTTNSAGDFMLFGIPIGQQTIHFDLDLSDMDNLSLSPADMIASGVPENEFSTITTTGGNSGFRFKESTNLDILPQIKTTNIDVNVQPFWGDTEQCQVGITRLDWNVEGRFTPSAIFFGGTFVDGNGFKMGQDVGGRCNNDDNSTMTAMRTDAGIVDYVGLSDGVTLDDHAGERKYGFVEIAENGNWFIVLPMIEGRVITDVSGNIVPSNDSSGLATYGDYRFKFTLNQMYQVSQSDNARGIAMCPHYSQGTLTDGEFNNWLGSSQTPYGAVSSNNDIYGFPERRWHNFSRFRAGQVYTIGQLIRTANNSPNAPALANVLRACNVSPILSINQFPGNHTGFNLLGQSFFSDSEYFYGSFYFTQFNLTNNMQHCEDLVWGEKQGTGSDSAPGGRRSDPPYYYKTMLNGTTKVKNLTAINTPSYDFFKTKEYKKLPSDLPTTSYEFQPTATNQSINQYSDGKYYYFGINKGGEDALTVARGFYNI